MNNVKKSTLQGWTENIGHGLAKRLGILAVGAAFIVSPMASSTAQAGGITQLQGLQLIAQMAGEQLPATATAGDYVQWAQAKGMSPNGGWQPGAKLTRQALAQVLVQLYQLKDSKNGGDYARILQREGISLPDEEEVSREGLIRLADDPVIIHNQRIGKKGNKKDKDNPPLVVNRNDDPAHKVTICHRGKNTITVSKNALQAHLAHGDTISACVPTETQNR